MKAIIDGQEFELKAKKFKTGNTGFHCAGAIIRNNKLFRVNILLVESDPNKKAKK